jgi:hypothetical protein
VVLTDNATGYVFADALRIVRTSARWEQITDDGDPGFSTAGTWGIGTPAGTYQGDQRYSAKGTGADTATWTVSSLPTDAYKVFVHWAGSGTINRASNAPFTVYDGASSLGTVLVNQQVTPGSAVDDRVSWQRLGTFTISSGVLKVVLSDKANGYVFADAIRVASFDTAEVVSNPSFGDERVYRPPARARLAFDLNDPQAVITDDITTAKAADKNCLQSFAIAQRAVDVGMAADLATAYEFGNMTAFWRLDEVFKAWPARLHSRKVQLSTQQLEDVPFTESDLPSDSVCVFGNRCATVLTHHNA